MFLSLLIRFNWSRLPKVTRELLFGGHPVIDIQAISTPTRLVEFVGKASDLVPCGARAAAGVLGHHLFAYQADRDIRKRHSCILALNSDDSASPTQSQCRSLDGCQNWCAFVLHQEHQELGRHILARVSA